MWGLDELKSHIGCKSWDWTTYKW